MDTDYVMTEMKKGRGAQFDPDVLDAFLRLVDKNVINLEEIYAQKRAEIQNADKEAQEELKRRVEEDKKIQEEEMKEEKKRSAADDASGKTGDNASEKNGEDASEKAGDDAPEKAGDEKGGQA